LFRRYRNLSSQSGGGVNGCVIQWQESTDLGVNWQDISGANNPDYTTATLTQTTYYRAIYTCAGAGCNQAVSNVQIVTVNPLPTITTSSNSPVCAGSDLQLNASGGDTYAWSGPDGFTANIPNPTITAVTTNATGNYLVTVTDANGCSSTAQISVLINTSLTTSVTTTIVSCNGGSNGTATANIIGGTSPYTYAWSNGGTTSPINNLIADTYTVTVTDTNGCSGIGIGIVSEPVLLSASLVINNEIDCFGGTDGAATITANGGTAPYSYLWSNNTTTNVLNNVVAGTYLATITDANGCTQTLSATLNEPAEIIVTLDNNTPVGCNGASDGSLTISVSGGTPGYTYLWSDGSTTEDVSGLSAGNYVVTVTDANGCTSTIGSTVSSPSSLAVTATLTQVLCNGGNNGSIDATVTGGTSPYTYLWSDGSTTEDIGGLTAGNYVVTVTDFNGCNITDTYLITAPSAIAITVDSSTPTTCNGAPTGSIAISVSGGTPGYTYLWSDGSTTEDVSGLSAGNYVVTVTDANGCTSTIGSTVSSPSSLGVTATLTQVLCNGGNNGSIDATVTGGTSPYTYLWSNGSTTEDIGGLTAGNYGVTVTDFNGCNITDTYLITEPSAVAITVDSSTPTTCNGAPTGSISISVTGGTPGYTYLWSDGSTTEDVSGLSAGNYVVTVTDANGCTSTIGSTVSSPSSLGVTATLTQVLCNGGNNGSIDATVTGGTSPYTYLWSNGSTTEDIGGLTAGNYVVTVTDFNGCNITDTYLITEPSAIIVSVDSSTPTTCNGAPTGSISISVSGGTPNYTYLWSDGSTTEDVSGLSAGNYVVTVTDANGCTSTIGSTVGSPSSLAVTATLTQVLCNGGNNGSIDAR
jgi:predicted RNase H-like HicB family nuclease